MIKVNYHIHSTYCDGQNTLEEMVEAAIQAGLTSIGLTSHMTLPFKNNMSILPGKLEDYLAAIEALKLKYQDRIEVYRGLEIDYFIERQEISSASREVMGRLDYTIMSIHSMRSSSDDALYYVDKTPENFSQGIEKFYGGSVKAFVKDYYLAVAEMVEKYQPEIVGHLDLIKKFNGGNRFFDDQEAWYQELVCGCLDRLAGSGAMIEINTGANFRKPGVGRYPSDWIIPEMKKRHIPITIGGDSHSAKAIVTEYQEAQDYLLACGYEEYYMLSNDRWQAVPFEVK